MTLHRENSHSTAALCRRRPRKVAALAAITLRALRHIAAVLFLALVSNSAAMAQIERFSLGAPKSAGGQALRGMNESSTPHPSVVRVIAPERDGISMGSGTLIDVRGSYGLVISNWHVVRDATGQLSVVFPDGFRSTAYVLKVDRDWDLAALAIWRPNTPPVQVARDAPQIGERLTIAGYGTGNYRSAQGNAAQFLSPGVGMPHDIVELSAEARQGDSGGPIFNSRGELAGVLFGSAQGLTSGSHARRLRWFMQSIVPDSELGRWEPALAAQQTQPLDNAAATSPLVPKPVATATVDPFVTSQQPVAGAWSGANGSTSFPPPMQVAATNISAANQFNNGTGASQPALPPTAIPADGYPPQDHAPANDGFDWRVVVGKSPIEQLKAALAMVGLLVLIERGLQWFVASSQPAPKARSSSKSPPSDG